jgi:hypothetical protein
MPQFTFPSNTIMIFACKSHMLILVSSQEQYVWIP